MQELIYVAVAGAVGLFLYFFVFTSENAGKEQARWERETEDDKVAFEWCKEKYREKGYLYRQDSPFPI